MYEDSSSKSWARQCVPSQVPFPVTLPEPLAPCHFAGGDLGTHLAGWAGFSPERLCISGHGWGLLRRKAQKFNWIFLNKFFCFSSSWESPVFSWAELFPQGCLHTTWLVHKASKEEFQGLISLTVPSAWKALQYFQAHCCSHWCCPFKCSLVQCLWTKGSNTLGLSGVFLDGWLSRFDSFSSVKFPTNSFFPLCSFNQQV